MRWIVLLFGLLCCLIIPAMSGAASAPQRIQAKGLQHPAWVVRDEWGIAHILAHNEHDAFFLQGYVQAEDRLFQMDVNRRRAQGRLAELLGPEALRSDVFFRTLGLGRGAQRSLEAYSEDVKAVMRAYARGVNAYASTHALAPEYAVLELGRFEPWTPLDTAAVVKLVAFGLSFDAGDIDRSVALAAYQQAGAALGFDGRALFFEDVFRAAPFDPSATVPDAQLAPAVSQDVQSAGRPHTLRSPVPDVELGKRHLQRLRQDPYLRRLLDEAQPRGSNEWAVSARFTRNGRALLANDPHLELSAPSTFYPIHLKAGKLDVIGSSFVGAPSVVLGHNRHIAWGATVNLVDVVDFYQERIVPDASSPSGLSSVYLGTLEHVLPIPEFYRANPIGDGVFDNLTAVPPSDAVPAFTLILPRRNHGPLLELDPNTGAALSVQYTGFGATHELETFLRWDRARTLDEFVAGLHYFDFGAQNFAYADVKGNIAYFTSGEWPLREDLQAQTVNGLPPYFIRNGLGGNEWIVSSSGDPTQALPYESLPFEEMPQLINPPRGWFVNANNDPAGTSLDNNPLNTLRPGGGIYYLHYGFQGGFRAARITKRIEERLRDGLLSARDMRAIQADNVLHDAEVFVPYITRALRRARQTDAHPALAHFAQDTAVVEAAERLGAWDFTTPTGLDDDDERYGNDDDKNDAYSVHHKACDAQAAGVAASLYTLWRAQFIEQVIDARLTPYGLPVPGDQQVLAALRHLLENFDTRQGVGASGLDFFALPGVNTAEDRRDIIILQALADTLEALAGDAFAGAFNHSRDQDDYLWGKLHRALLIHPLGGPFNIPPAGSGALPGIATDGGFQSVDAATHPVRVKSAEDLIYSAGPATRFTARAGRRGMQARAIWPGGVSGVPGDVHYADLLPLWVRNETVPLLTSVGSIVSRGAGVRVRFTPASK